MTFTFLEILLILLTHWVADFILQTDKQAKGKSKEWKHLISHTSTYSLCWFPFLIFSISQYDLLSPILLFLFIPITFVLHTITDYFTSRLNSKLWVEGKTHEFFVSIGADQILHYVQLFLTYKILLTYAT